MHYRAPHGTGRLVVSCGRVLAVNEDSTTNPRSFEDLTGDTEPWVPCLECQRHVRKALR